MTIFCPLSSLTDTILVVPKTIRSARFPRADFAAWRTAVSSLPTRASACKGAELTLNPFRERVCKSADAVVPPTGLPEASKSTIATAVGISRALEITEYSKLTRFSAMASSRAETWGENVSLMPYRLSMAAERSNRMVKVALPTKSGEGWSKEATPSSPVVIVAVLVVIRPFASRDW